MKMKTSTYSRLLYSVMSIIFFISCFFHSWAQTTIKMEKDGGVFTIPCTVNGLELDFIFDTGASDVSISLTEALFMLKNKYMNEEDIVGEEYFEDATGTVSAGTKVILRKIEFAGYTLTDVEASVVHELSAPLLLGQTAMEQLGKFEFDPVKGTLTILKQSDYKTNVQERENYNNWESSISVSVDNKLWAEGLRIQAKKELVTIAHNSPDDAMAQYNAGAALVELGNDSALLFFDRGIKADESIPHNFIGKGRVYLDHGKIEDAKSYFIMAQSKAKKSAEVATFIGESWSRSKNRNADEAFKMFEKAKELDSKYVKLYIALGDWYLAKNDGGNAITNYERATELNAVYCLPYYKIGQVYFLSKNYSMAKQYLEQLFNVCPDFAGGLLLMGETNFMLQNYMDSKDNYQKYLEIVGSDIDAEKRLASILFVAKDYQGAMDMARRVLEKDPKNFVAKRILGYSTFESGDDLKALEIMTEYFKTVNDSDYVPLDYEYLGRIYSKQKNDSVAVINLSIALKMDSSKPDLYDLIAKSQITLKKFDEAAATYERKLLLDGYTATPTDYYQLGICYYSIGASYQTKATVADSLVNAQLSMDNYHLADSAFIRITEILPTAVIGFFWRGRANAAMDPTTKLGLAKPFYEKVIENSITDPAKFKKELIETYLYLGYYYYFNEGCKSKNAKDNYSKVLEFDESNQNAKDALKAIVDCKP